MNNSNGSVSRSSSTAAGHTTLRPRASRYRADQATSTHLTLPHSPTGSRSTSPLNAPPPPSSASARSGHKAPPVHTRPSVTASDPRHLHSNASAPSLATLWGTSWNAIQGIASDLLNADGSYPDDPARVTPTSGFFRSSSSATHLAKDWGPSNTNDLIGQGSAEERDALVRAQKRKDLLLAGHSTAGRMKRRSSDDRDNMSSEQNIDREHKDTLVYVHRVQPQDTVAGITIRYGCSAQTLRKANRIWPNDTIQTRKILVLPVSACSVKGKLTGPPEQAAVSDAADDSETPDPLPSRMRAESFSNQSQRTSGSTQSASELEQSWTHDSWTSLPNSSTPTQIVRLPRRALGYFPPARRKSQGHSDFDSRATSLDVGRQSTSDDVGATAIGAAAAARPSMSPGRVQRTRRPSNALTGYFPSYLAGPGGVGTLDPNVRTPGPAQDGLNKMFAGHLPNVAPPVNQQGLYLPEMPISFDNESGILTPFESGQQSPRINLENVGGAIENWMRKVATKASNVLDPADRRVPAAVSAGRAGRGAGSMGDLIEMADSFDIGPASDEDDEHDDDDIDDRGLLGQARGRRQTTGSTTGTGSSLGQMLLQQNGVGTRLRGGRASASPKAGKRD